MAMPAITPARRYTAAEVLAFPADGNRYEVVHGELLVTPAPRAGHQVVVTEILARIHGYLGALGRPAVVLAGPADITWDEETTVQPDILVVPLHEVTSDWRSYRTLLLAVEVLSPSSTRGDRVVKRRLYQEQRVGLYWIVDADKRLVEAWRPDDEAAEIVTDVLRWQVTPEAPCLEIVLGDVFGVLPS
jgi:Uma2 family endonuclease